MLKGFTIDCSEERIRDAYERSILKCGFNLVIRRNRGLQMPYVPHLRENNIRKGFFEPWQFDNVLAKPPDYIRPPITFTHYTGWRLQHEILPLTWDRVDLAEGTVRLYRGTTKNREGRGIPPPRVLTQILLVVLQLCTDG